MFEERVDVVGSLLRLAASQADELIALRAENLRLLTLGLLNLADLVGKRAATGYGKAACRTCQQTFVKQSQRSEVCPDCKQQSKERCMAAARLKSPLLSPTRRLATTEAA